MPRYFFHTQDGQCLTDREGTDLADLAQARREAVQFLSELLNHSSETLLHTGHFSIIVSDETGLTLFRIDMMFNDAPAAPKREPRRAPSD